MSDKLNWKFQEMDIHGDGESIELPNTDGGRITKLAPSDKMISFLYEDAKTQVEAIERGCRLSGNGRCLGWRRSNSEYSWITYKDYMKRARNFGSGLIQLGIRLGQSTIVGIYAQNSIEWLVAQLGCFYHSSPIAPLYDTLGSDACTYMINNGELPVIVCDKERKVKSLLEKIEETRCLEHIIYMNDVSDAIKQLAIQKGVRLHFFKDIENLGKSKPSPRKLPKPDDVAEICYTSGTTGNPKGAILTHENIIAAVSGMVLQMGSVTPDKNDIMISYLPLAHVLEQACEVMTLLNGGSIGFFKGDITLLLEDMKVLHPTFFPAVPRLLNKLYDKALSQINCDKLKINDMELLENEKSKTGRTIKTWNPSLYKTFLESLGGNIRLIVTAAAPISDIVLSFYREAIGCNVVELYGQTETTGPCTTNVVSEKSLGNVGPPIACCMIKLKDVPDLGYFTNNNTGELCVKGYNVLKGYHKDPERTRESIDEDGWLHTGDVAMWLPNGTLRIIDRKKHILKLSQGEYVAPEKLENIYLQSPFISQILIHGDSLQSFLVAIVIPDQEVIVALCKENSKCSQWTEACKDPAIKQLILNDMRQISKAAGLFPFEQVKRIHIHSKLLTFEEGHLTPTLKTKREICRKYFALEIQEMYSENSV